MAGATQRPKLVELEAGYTMENKIIDHRNKVLDKPIKENSQAVTVCLADIKSEPISWLWQGRIALGKLTLIAGDPGLGKSLLTTTLAAHVSKGYQWPVDATIPPKGSVLLLSAEDDAADTIKPRLEAAKADCQRIHIIHAIRNNSANGSSTERMFSLSKDIQVLEGVLSSMKECRLLIIDPISAYIDGIDSYKNSAVRGLLAPLSAIAAKYHIAIILVTHLNKGNSTNALYRPMESLAFIANARSSYIVTKNKDNPEARLFLPIKNNLSEDNTGLSFSVIGADNGSAVITWGTKAVTISADEAIAPRVIDGEQGITNQTMDFLRALLSNGPVKAGECQREARGAGISVKSLRTARERLGIKPRKCSFSGGWEWALPIKVDAEEDQDIHSKETGTFDANGRLHNKTAEDSIDEKWFDSLPVLSENNTQDIFLLKDK